jgi:hypothetical protein
VPVFIIGADERLTYTPDREGFANFPPALREAITVWVQQAEVLATPLHVPPALLDAVGRIANLDAQDVTYTYKRLPGNVRAALIHKYTIFGVTDVHSARWAMGEAALLGWHNVLDADGHQVPFDKALIPGLPGDHVFQIGILCDAGAPTDFLARWLGSSNGNSSSKGTTAPGVASA